MGKGYTGRRQEHSMNARGIKTKNLVVIDKGYQPIIVTSEESEDYMDAWNETIRAYGDVNTHSDRNDRSLDFRSDFELSPDLAEEVMDDALNKYGQYNDFEPHLINRLDSVFINPRVVLAREGSVTMYIRGKPKVDLSIIKDSMKANEVHVIGGMTRIWWD